MSAITGVAVEYSLLGLGGQVHEWQGSRQGNTTCTAEGPVPVPPPDIVARLEEARPFEKKGKVARSPPAALTPPPSERTVGEEPGSEAAAFHAGTMNTDDRTLANLLARMGEVLMAQGTVQRVMVTQQNEFQASMEGVFRSHDNQLEEQVATQQNMVQQMSEFQNVILAVLNSQTET